MDLKIYIVEDGGERFTFAAFSPQDADARFREYALEVLGCSEDDIAEAHSAYLLPLKDAEERKVRLDSGEADVVCHHCAGTGRLVRSTTVLELFHKYRRYQSQENFPHGLLCSTLE